MGKTTNISNLLVALLLLLSIYALVETIKYYKRHIATKTLEYKETDFFIVYDIGRYSYFKKTISYVTIATKEQKYKETFYNLKGRIYKDMDIGDRIGLRDVYISKKFNNISRTVKANVQQPTVKTVGL